MSWEKDYYDLFKVSATVEESIEILKESKNMREKNGLKYLYKYMGANDYVFENLEKDLLVVRKPYEYNDPFEAVHYIENQYNFFNNSEIKIMNSKGYEYTEREKKIILDEMCKIVREKQESSGAKYLNNVLCLSSIEKSILMWSHYSESHKGICVQYEFEDIFMNNVEDEENGINIILPMQYSDKVPIIKEYGKEAIKPIYFTKSEEWSYEKEWRVLINNKEIIDNKGLSFIKMPKPRSIILGCKASEDTINKAKEICKKRSIELYHMKRFNFEFKLNKELIYKPS